MTNKNLTKLTFKNELKRAVCSGIYETAGTTFLLLIAVRWYNAGALEKGLISGANSIGLLLSPFILFAAQHLKLTAGYGAAIMLVLAGIGYLLSASMHNLLLFTVFVTISGALAGSVTPLLTAIYHSNYPSKKRGKLFSRAFSLRIATATVFSFLGGRFLTNSSEQFWIMLVIFGLSLIISGTILNWFETPILSKKSTHKLRDNFHLAYDDTVFRNTLISWMFLGFGNLMMFPLRIEYLANPVYGIALSPDLVALMCGVIPNVVRLCLSPVWGILFDRVNFFALRVSLNIGFAFGILTFFLGDSFWGLFAGSVAFGVASAGADVAWNLWVTKFAPEDKVAGYMSVHTFLTGLRGIIAPIAAFQLLHVMTIQHLSWVSLGLIGIACLILIPELLAAKRGRVSDEPPEGIETPL